MSITMLQPVPEDWERALAVVAHPDDLEYGAASAIARWTDQGKHITYLLATRGEAGIDGMSPSEAGHVREEEERNSAREVGVDTVEFLGLRDGVLEYGLPLRRDIARTIRQYRPEVLISITFQLTWPGNHLNMADHRHLGLALLDAARDAGNRWIFPELVEEGLDPWTGVRMVLFSGSSTPTHAVDTTESIGRGIASLEQHRAYIQGLGREFDVATFLRGGAELVGKQFGTELATSFEVFYP